MKKIALPLLLMGVAAIYSFGIGGPFILDDMQNLEPLMRLDSAEVSKLAIICGNISGLLGRPVSMITFAFDYFFHGLSPAWFKVSNIVLHLGCGSLLYFFLLLILRQSPHRNESEPIALFIAAAWLLSPLFSSTVLYVVQRMAILATLFSLAALIAYLQLRAELVAGRFKILWAGLLLLFAVLAVFSKENAALLPLMIAVTEYFFCAPIADGIKRTLRNQIFLFFVFMPVALGLLAILAWHNKFLNFEMRNFTLEQRVLTESRIVWTYVLQLLIPQSSSFGLFHDDIRISKSILSPVSTLLSIVSWLIAVSAALVSYRYVKWRMAGGAVLFFMVGHIMESTVLPLELYFEHRNYLPGIGVYLLLPLLATKVINGRVLRMMIGAGYLLAFAVALSQRVLMWSNYDLLIYSSYQAHPMSSRTNIEAALRDAFNGNLEGALAKIQRVKEIDPNDELGANIQLIYTYCIYNASGLGINVADLANGRTNGAAYTATALVQMNEQYQKNKCQNVPYEAFIVALANRYESEMRAGNSQEVAKLSSIQIPLLESLNYFVHTDKTIEVAELINQSNKGGFSVDLLTAVALIDRGRLVEANALIQKQKLDESIQAKIQAAQLRQIETLYESRKVGRG